MERLDFRSTWPPPKVSGISKWPTLPPCWLKLNWYPVPCLTTPCAYWEIKIISKGRHTIFIFSDFIKKISQEISSLITVAGRLSDMLFWLPQLHLLHFPPLCHSPHVPTMIPSPLSWTCCLPSSHHMLLKIITLTWFLLSKTCRYIVLLQPKSHTSMSRFMITCLPPYVIVSCLFYSPYFSFCEIFNFYAFQYSMHWYGSRLSKVVC